VHAGELLMASLAMLTKRKRDFEPESFLATIGVGRKVVAFPRKEIVFAQGDAADSVFYIREGKVRLTVVSKIGKEVLWVEIGLPLGQRGR